MIDTLGYRNFCQACIHSRQEGETTVCKNKDSVFYNKEVGCILMAPCFCKKKERRNKMKRYMSSEKGKATQRRYQENKKRRFYKGENDGRENIRGNSEDGGTE